MVRLFLRVFPAKNHESLSHTHLQGMDLVEYHTISWFDQESGPVKTLFEPRLFFSYDCSFFRVILAGVYRRKAKDFNHWAKSDHQRLLRLFLASDSLHLK